MGNKLVGNLWNDRSVEIVEIEGNYYVLDRWNGEEWDGWRVEDKRGYEATDEEATIKPIYEEDEDGDFYIIDYVLLS